MNVNEKSFITKITDKLLKKLSSEDTWLALGEALIEIMLVWIIANLLVRFGRMAIHNIFKIRNRSPLRTSERREETLEKLLENILSYVVYFIAIITILSLFGINVQAILAGAGIVGLAVGFGAQSLVKDIISGFFIIFEDQFSVGDHIRIGEFEGDVEAIGLRTTKLKNWTGEVHILPNGSITQVTNYSLNNSVACVDVSIAYGEDIDKAESVIGELLGQLPEQYPELVGVPQLLGVQNMGPSEVVLRIVAETLPMQHFYIARIIRKEVKRILDESGIKVPLPKLVMYTRSAELDKEHTV